MTERTLINWMNRFNKTEWNFGDISQRPHTIYHKFTEKEKQIVVNVSKKEEFSSQKLLIFLLIKIIQNNI